MSFFYHDIKKDPPKPKGPSRGASRREIPIQSLQQLGCSVCPRDKDAGKLDHPKLKPTGAKKPLIYLLGTGPNEDEDRTGEHWTGPAGEVILSKFTRSFVRKEMRFGHLTQCSPLAEDSERDLRIGVAEMECCRPRVVDDIEESAPLVVIGVGDIPIQWVTGFDGNKANAKIFRGKLIAAKIGRHECWFYPIMWPNFISKERKYGQSEYELALSHDIRFIEQLVETGQLPELTYYSKPYDKGIELITGREAGDMKRLERALADIASLPKSALDIETNALRVYKPKQPKIWTAAVGTFDRTVAFPIDHPDGWGTEARQRHVWDLFGEFLLYSGEKICHNLAMEMEWLAFFYGGKILRLTTWNDTMSMAHTLDERSGTKSLDLQCLFNFGFLLKNQSPVDPSRPNWIEHYTLEEVLRYNGMDTKWTFRLCNHYEPLLAAAPESQLLEHERKVRLAPTLVLMEAKGLPVDLDFAKKLDDRYHDEGRELERKIRKCPEVQKYEKRFGSFDPGNPDQVLKLLKDICDREEIRRVDKKTKKETLSSDEEVLSSLPHSEVPSAPLILEHRGVEKLRSTYIGPVIAGKATSYDGRIHTKYSSMHAVTGRLAAEDPAVQNWPIRKYPEVRGIVTAERKRRMTWILACDYGAIEARCFAMASQDEKLTRYLWTDYDIHGHWAKRIHEEYPEVKDWIVSEFGVDWDEKGMKTLRQEAKNKWVFPQFFGSAARSCAANLHLPEHVADELAAEFWEDEFRGVKKWQKDLLRSYEKNLYVETMTGRRRRGPMTLNELLNHPIQGTAFDIVGAGMNALSERAMESDDEELQQALQVHDDNSFWIDDETLEPKMKIIAEEMCRHRFDWINVPLLVEMKAGPRWSELKEVAKYRSDKLFNLRNPYA